MSIVFERASKSIDSIEYLRGIGVLIIVIGHLGITWFPGGHLSVDMFFLVAGFLATKIIITDYENRRFSFTTYYQRRIVRLTPSFLAVLVFTLISSAVLLSADALKVTATTALYSIFQVVNFYFIVNVDYFAPQALESPFVHLWTLSLEEQFFLIFPMIMLLLLKLEKYKKIIIAFVICILCNLFFNEFLHSNRQLIESSNVVPSGQLLFRVDRALFYATVARLFEFFVGSLFYLYFFKIAPNHFMIGRVATSLLGYCFCVFSWLFLDEQRFDYPGIYHLIPLIGAGLIIIGGDNRLYSSPWPQKTLGLLGASSYAIYLSHWPIISFAFILGADLNNPLTLLGLFTLSLASGIAITIFLEAPIRRRYAKQKEYGVRVVKTCGIVVLFVVLLSWCLKTVDSSVFEVESRFSRNQINDYFTIPPPEKSEIKVAILGESHATHWLPMFRRFFSGSTIRVEDFSGSGCIPILDVGIFPQSISYFRNYEIDEINPVCERYHQIIREKVVKEYDAVILSAAWDHYIAELNGFELKLRTAGKKEKLSQASLHRELIRSVAFFEQNNMPVLLMGQVPNTLINTIECKKSIVRRKISDCSSSIGYESQKQRSQVSRKLFNAIDSMYADVIYIDSLDKFCSEQSYRCITELYSAPLYRDDNHLSAIGSPMLVELYREDLQKFRHLLLSESNTDKY